MDDDKSNPTFKTKDDMAFVFAAHFDATAAKVNAAREFITRIKAVVECPTLKNEISRLIVFGSYGYAF